MQHDVLGLEIPVNDPFFMGSRQTVGNLHADLDRLFERNVRTFRTQRLPFHKFHHDEHLRFVLFRAVDGADVRMIQRGGGFRLLDEAGLILLRGGEVGGKELERDMALQGCILGLVDNAHPPLSQFLYNLIMRDCGTNHISPLEQPPTESVGVLKVATTR